MESIRVSNRRKAWREHFGGIGGLKIATDGCRCDVFSSFRKQRVRKLQAPVKFADELPAASQLGRTNRRRSSIQPASSRIPLVKPRGRGLVAEWSATTQGKLYG